IRTKNIRSRGSARTRSCAAAAGRHAPGCCATPGAISIHRTGATSGPAFAPAPCRDVGQAAGLSIQWKARGLPHMDTGEPMTASPWDRFRLIAVPVANRQAAFARDVAAGLAASPKRLSCCYFYDAEGSRLFEAICELPEYYLTRAEASLLHVHAAEIAA